MQWGKPSRGRLALGGLAIGLATIGAVSACTAKKNNEIVLALQTDLSLPKDVDTIRIEVTQAGQDLFLQDYPVGPDGAKIPATLGVVGNGSDLPVRIRVIARHQGTLRVLRQNDVTIPQSYTALLRMPLQWLCWNHDDDLGDGGAQPNCDAGEACFNGACADDTVNAGSLPAFESSLVFGSGPSGSNPGCFDTIGCFSQGEMVEVQTSDCTIAMPLGGEGINVAMVKDLGSTGICGDVACYFPFDDDPQIGWVENPEGRVALPPAACQRLTDPLTPEQTLAGIAVTTACATKTASTPVCGPWSSVGADAGTFEAGAPLGFDAGPPDDASIVLPDGAVCDPSVRWPAMLTSPLEPPEFGGLDFSNGDLTVQQAELVNCGGQPAFAIDGAQYSAVTWGPSGDVYAEYVTATGLLHSVTVRDSYSGLLAMPSRSGGPFGAHSYSVGVNVLMRDGAAWAIDWSNPDAVVSELYDAYAAAFVPGSQPVTDCVQGGQCYTVVGADAGPSGFGFIAAPDMYFVFAPNGQAPTELYRYVDLGGTGDAGAPTTPDAGVPSNGDAGAPPSDAGAPVVDAAALEAGP